jgi:hypothetical protein
MIITMNELNRLYAEKLLETGSHDKAILKVAWVAFCHGKDGSDMKSEFYDDIPEVVPFSPNPTPLMFKLRNEKK